MTRALTPYEAYYRDVGLNDYERIFQTNDEISLEVSHYLDAISTWPGWGNKYLRILDIGCGFGTFTRLLIERAPFWSTDTEKFNRRRHIDCDLVDVNPSAFASYESHIGASTQINININRCISDVWENVQVYQLSHEYDLVIANHCFYGAEISPELITSLLARVSRNGLLLLALTSNKSDISQMRKEAGIHINSSEQIDIALRQVPCKIFKRPYSAHFTYTLRDSLFTDWLFATSKAPKSSQSDLLKTYSHYADLVSLPYLINRACVYTIAPLLLSDASLSQCSQNQETISYLPIIRSQEQLDSSYEKYYADIGLLQYEKVFSKNTEKQIEADLCARHLNQWILQMWDRPTYPKPLRVLDIGCGLGLFTTKFLLAAFGKQIPSLNINNRLPIICDLVDLNPDAFEYFQETVQATPSTQLKISVGNRIEQKWAQAQNQVGIYDIIIANHVFYGCDINSALIDSIVGRLSAGGVALIAHISCHSHLIRLREAAGGKNNVAEEIEDQLNECGYTFDRLLYESKFRYDEGDDLAESWFLGGTLFNATTGRHLLHEFTEYDEVGSYIPNRAMVHVVYSENSVRL